VDKSAVSITEFIMEYIIYRYLVPKAILHDQGMEFCNALNEHVCAKLGIKRQISSAYHPQTNGLTERFNQTLVTKLMGQVNKQQNDWDTNLGSVLSGYRAGIQNATRCSPFMMMYGVKPRLPIEVEYNSFSDDNESVWTDAVPEEQVAAQIQECRNVMQEVRNSKLMNLKQAQKQQKKQYDLKHVGPFYSIGDQVMRKNMRRETRQGDKLIARWDGPFKIAETLGKGSYRIKKPNGEILQQRITSTRLKRFHPAEAEESDDPEKEATTIKRMKENDDDDDSLSLIATESGHKAVAFRPITTATI